MAALLFKHTGHDRGPRENENENGQQQQQRRAKLKVKVKASERIDRELTPVCVSAYLADGI